MRQTYLRKHFGTRLRDLRKEQHLSGTELAVVIERHKTWISHVETGRYATSLDTISRFAEVLAVDEMDLFTFPEINIRHAINDLTRKVPIETLAEVRDLLLQAAKESEMKEQAKQKRLQLRSGAKRSIQPL